MAEQKNDHQLQKSMDSAIVTINEKGIIMSVDRKTCELFGYTIEELQLKKVNILIPSPYKEQHDTYLKNYFETGIKKIIDKTRVVEGLCKDGSVFPITLSITEVFIWNKRMFIGSIEPVIDKRLILYTDVNGVMTYCNRAIEEMLGYTPSEIFGKNVSTLMPSPHATSHQSYINKNYHGNGILKMLGRIRNLPIKHKSGVVFLVSILVTKISTDGIDMFKAIIQTPPQEAVFTVDNEGIIKSCNFNFTEPMFGYPQKELIGNTIGLLIPEMSKVITEQQQQVQSSIMLNSSGSSSNSSSKIQSPSDYNQHDDREGIECWLGKTRKVNVYHKDGSNFPVNLEIIKLQPSPEGSESNYSIQIKRFVDPNSFHSPSHGQNNSGNNNNNNINSSSQNNTSQKSSGKKDKNSEKKRKNKRQLSDNEDDEDEEDEDDRKNKKSKSTSNNNNNNNNNGGSNDSPISNSTPVNYPQEIIGEYIMGKTLGRGNYGIVKLGTHVKSRLEIAIKIIYRDQMTEPEYLRCKREIEILKILNHPNINKLLNVLEKDDSMYIFMEYCTGGDLLGYINDKDKVAPLNPLLKDKVHIKMGSPLSEEESRRIFTQISLGISHCHHLNIAHRDIKHKNILFDDKHNVKIIDFGLSNWSFQNFVQSFCGTPVYSSPEMILGIAYSGPEVDIWSLGVILYSLPSGYLPFPNVSDIINGKYHIPSSFSMELQDLIKQMLNVDREKRIPINSILQHPWIQKDNPFLQEINQQLLQQQYQKQNLQISTPPNTTVIQPNHNIVGGSGVGGGGSVTTPSTIVSGSTPILNTPNSNLNAISTPILNISNNSNISNSSNNNNTNIQTPNISFSQLSPTSSPTTPSTVPPQLYNNPNNYFFQYNPFLINQTTNQNLSGIPTTINPNLNNNNTSNNNTNNNNNNSSNLISSPLLPSTLPPQPIPPQPTYFQIPYTADQITAIQQQQQLLLQQQQQIQQQQTQAQLNIQYQNPNQDFYNQNYYMVPPPPNNIIHTGNNNTNLENQNSEINN
ncbi:putative protein serine/threonine kinase [Tieghemostelium lacteum]|uniref:non-specific serine/threonine protein kinase n=1 Tax=Tieghemostelium lacteum TaxID=361077 RepID=A0A152A6X4_TIELA|nr:putative protein serine/threonine kinase [Tieghemostelium lacteum]|eukprot:KYR01871.1 putative protein serine/threonine kinase [Tieghemostelium lacteum]